MSKCGGCTVCCQINGVPELKKPIHTGCRYARVGFGCDMYDMRPASCRGYECLWFASELEEDLRPDKCHVLFTKIWGKNTVIAVVVKGYKFEECVKARLYIIGLVEVSGLAVAIVDRNERLVVLPKQKTMDEVLAEIKEASFYIAGFDSVRRFL